MDSLQLDVSSPSDDLSALAWVHEELRKSLDAAHKALHRCLKDATSHGLSDMDSLDPAVLRTARQQIHQGVGALELAGLPAGATVLRASEAVVQKFVSRPQLLNEDAIREIERASFALLDYIARRLAGKEVSAMALFPQYEVLVARAGGGMARPTDLWSQDWPTLSLEAPLEPPAGATPRAPDSATVNDFELGLLKLMRRNQPADAVSLAALCASLAADAARRQSHRESATWMLASGFLEGLAGNHVPLSVHAKRVLSSLLSQLRVLVKGQGVPSDRLASELLFFCAQAGDVPAGDASVLARVRRTFGLARHKPVNLASSSLGKYDPAWIAQALKRVAGAKDGWSAVAADELLRLGGLNEQFALICDSLRRLFPQGEVLSEALMQAAQHTVAAARAPEPGLAMEVATSLLYIEACLEDGEFDQPEQQARVERLAERIRSVSQGQAPQPLEAWMEDLYRRVSDRQTIGSVVQELRTTLSECEKHIDQFFREPQERSPLAHVPALLQSMRGVLAVLGLDLAAQATVRMRGEVDHLLQPETDLEQAGRDGVFDRLASNLGALGFLIDMMGVQPGLAKSLFTFDEVTGVLAPVMGREKKIVLTPADPVEAVAQQAEQIQLEQAQTLVEDVAQALERDDISLSEVSEHLQKLAATPAVQEQSDLADSLAAIQAALATAETADDEAAAAAVREQAAQALSDFSQSVSDAATLDAEPDVALAAPAPAPLAPTPVAAPAETGLEEDDEMRDIFLEEAREVIENAREGLDQLSQHPADVGAMTAVRRAFHTLKGSSRMVGLKTYGEAGWACEQLYNSWLATQEPANDVLLSVTRELLTHFAAWTEAIANRQDAGWLHEPVAAVADALRLKGERLSLAEVLAAKPAEVPSVAEVVEPPADGVEAQADAAPVLDILDVAEALTPEPIETIEAGETVELATPEEVYSEPEVVLDFLLDEAEPVEVTEPAEPEAPAESAESAFALTMPQVLEAPAEAVAEVSELPAVSSDDVIMLDLADFALEPPVEAPALAEPVDADEPAIELAVDQPSDVEEIEPAVDLGLDLVISEPRDVVLLDDDDPTQAGTLEEAPLEAVAEDAQSTPAEAAVQDEQVKVVGPLRISIPLFNIYLNEADEQSRRLSTSLNEWALELHRPVGDDAIALAHSLAGNSGTVGYSDLSQLARLLEHALMRAQTLGGGDAEGAQLFIDASDEIRRLLHQFAAGFLKTPSAELMQRLSEFDQHASRRIEAQSLVGELEGEAERPETAPLEHPHLRLVRADEGLEAPADDEAADDGFAQATRPGALGVPEIKAFEERQDATAAPAQLGSASDRHWEDEADIDAVDNVDLDLFPIFEEEAQELLPQLATQVRQWRETPDNPASATACMRTLHTFKGGARLAGAMRLGELAHRLESAIEHLVASADVTQADVEPLEARVDRLIEVFESLQQQDAQQFEAQAAQTLPPVEPVQSEPVLAPVDASLEVPAVASMDVTEPAAEAVAEADAPLELATNLPDSDAAQVAPAVAARQVPELKLSPINWAALVATGLSQSQRVQRDTAQAISQAAVRVRPQLLDRLVNHAGEVSITRTRLESQVGQIRGSLTDLTDNLERLRLQLRDIELQAETQMSTRMEAARAASQNFDPLEFDRYTRFQELTRMMAESVNDVATVQRTLQRNLETAEDQLAAQARLTRDLQDDLLRTRMVEFEGLSDRLYRVVRLAAKETGKQVRLDIVGGATEVDRGVLERMTGAFEHLLRNCISHGIETPEQRVASGKEPAGLITVSLRQEGNEVSIEFRDDGAGLNLHRIRERAQAMGLLSPEALPADHELAQLIFTPGFSTADKVTELAGRGIGMDVVRSEVNAMGGRIETATAAGRGTSFTLVLPLTTAVTQVVMLRCGNHTVAVPTHLIEMVRRARPVEVEAAYKEAGFTFGDQVLPFYWLGALLDFNSHSQETARSLPVVIVRSAAQRIAVHVDEVLGNQEVVVKNLGAQMSRLPGLAGMTLLASGAVSLIYNPVALATVYGERAHALTVQALLASEAAPAGAAPQAPAVPAESLAPLVLVVDDSLTVRRVTQRLLSREGYRVALAKDGLEALEMLAQERPSVVLSDIEMPRMDGFDLVRNIRADQKLADLPVIMITSRIAQKHRDYAQELGVSHYLGKPYGEEELLALVGRYATQTQEAVA